jgi:hypothetical protein
VTAPTPIKRTFFDAHSSADATHVTIVLQGTADTRVSGSLELFLTEVHRQAIEVHAQQAVVDLRQLEFMNSSCFKGFITWLSMLQALGQPARYSVRFLSNAARHWQKRSLTALRCFALDCITIDEGATAQES